MKEREVENIITKFREFPNSVKNGILFLVTAWLFSYFFLYKLYAAFPGKFPEKFIYQQAAMGLFMTYFTVKIKNWGRVLCILCNIMISLLYILLSAHFFSVGYKNLSVLLSMDVGLFAMATYYLLVKETSDFFKAHNKKDPEDAPAEEQTKKKKK